MNFALNIPISETERVQMNIHLYEIKPRDRSVYGVEAKFTFKDLSDIKRWLGVSDSDWDYGMKRVKQSRAKRPFFETRSTLGVRTPVKVYPNELCYTGIEYRIHYICQHIFDSFPHVAKTIIYDYQNTDTTIGVLHTLDCKEIAFTCGDIRIGFSNLTQEMVDRDYQDKFSNWIISRHPDS